MELGSSVGDPALKNGFSARAAVLMHVRIDGSAQLVGSRSKVSLGRTQVGQSGQVAVGDLQSASRLLRQPDGSPSGPKRADQPSEGVLRQRFGPGRRQGVFEIVGLVEDQICASFGEHVGRRAQRAVGIALLVVGGRLRDPGRHQGVVDREHAGVPIQSAQAGEERTLIDPGALPAFATVGVGPEGVAQQSVPSVPTLEDAVGHVVPRPGGRRVEASDRNGESEPGGSVVRRIFERLGYGPGADVVRDALDLAERGRQEPIGPETEGVVAELLLEHLGRRGDNDRLSLGGPAC